MTRIDVLAPSGKQREARLRDSIAHRGSIDTPAITATELVQFNEYITWVTRLNEKTMREKRIAVAVVNQWTISLSKSQVPQVDQNGTEHDYRSLEEWVRAISGIFTEQLKTSLSKLPPNIRQ